LLHLWEELISQTIYSNATHAAGERIMKKTISTMLFVIFFFGIPAIALAEHIDYAVLFSGGIEPKQNYEKYYLGTMRMWNILTDTLGFDPLNIYILAGDGIDTAADLNKGTFDTPDLADSGWAVAVSSGTTVLAAEPVNLQNTLSLIGNNITGEDSFFFWSYDHGDGYLGDPNDAAAPKPPNDPTELNGWDSSIADNTFADWLKPIWDKDPLGEAYFFSQCFGAGMVDDLNIVAGENRFAAWAADWYEVGYSSAIMGWADALADALESGLRSTWSLGDYAKDHNNNPFAPPGMVLSDGTLALQHPGWLGANFDIVTNRPIPEPNTMVMLALGLMGFWGARANRRK